MCARISDNYATATALLTVQCACVHSSTRAERLSAIIERLHNPSRCLADVHVVKTPAARVYANILLEGK